MTRVAKYRKDSILDYYNHYKNKLQHAQLQDNVYMCEIYSAKLKTARQILSMLDIHVKDINS